METHSRAMVLGVWEGLLVRYVVESARPAAQAEPDSIEPYVKIGGIGLALGVGGRLVLDYSTTGDVEVLARGVVGMTVGVLIAEFAKQAIESFFPPSEPEVKSRRHRHRRIHTRHDEEVVEGAVPPSPAIAAPPPAATQVAPAVPSVPFVPVTTTSAPAIPIIHVPIPHSAQPMMSVPIMSGPTPGSSGRVPIISSGVARDMLSKGRRDIHVGEEESEESLERDVNVADGRRRKLQEEREWAKAQGDAARSAQLEAEIKRYKALSAELERRLKKRRSLVSLNGSGGGKGSGLPKSVFTLVENRNSDNRGPEPIPIQLTNPVVTTTSQPQPTTQPAPAQAISQPVQFPYTLDTPGSGPGPRSTSARSVTTSLPSLTSRPYTSPRVSFQFTPLPPTPPTPPQHHVRPSPSRSSLRSSNISRRGSGPAPVPFSVPISGGPSPVPASVDTLRREVPIMSSPLTAPPAVAPRSPYSPQPQSQYQPAPPPSVPSQYQTPASVPASIQLQPVRQPTEPIRTVLLPTYMSTSAPSQHFLSTGYPALLIPTYTSPVARYPEVLLQRQAPPSPITPQPQTQTQWQAQGQVPSTSTANYKDMRGGIPPPSPSHSQARSVPLTQPESQAYLSPTTNTTSHTHTRTRKTSHPEPQTHSRTQDKGKARAPPPPSSYYTSSRRRSSSLPPTSPRSSKPASVPIPIKIEVTPRAVPIHEGPPGPRTSDTTVPTSDEWSRALD